MRLHDQKFTQQPRTRQLKVVNERLRNVEALGCLSSTTLDDDDILKQPVAHEVLMIIELFFEQYGHFYPCVRKMSFINSIVQPASRRADQTTPLRACIHAMMSIAFRMAQFSASNDRSFDVNQRAEEHLVAALREGSVIGSSEPALLGAQALFFTAVSMTLSSVYTSKQACVVLASAVRIAQLVEGDRVLQARVLLSLYILDAELSLENNIHPLLQDDAGMMAYLDELEDERGRIKSLDGSVTIEHFAGRIKLARLQNQILMDMRAGQAQTSSRDKTIVTFDEMRVMLKVWNETYLPGSHLLQAEKWPATVYVHNVRLVVAHFLTIKTLYSGTISNASDLDTALDILSGTEAEQVQAFRTSLSVPPDLVDAARMAFTAVRSIGKAGLSWLMESLPTLLSATIVMYQAVVVEHDVKLARNELARADSWFYVLERLAGETTGDGLQSSIEVVGRLRRLAEYAAKSMV
ncbi:hypothetical protein AMS68_003372 [Peltaster fructicola]|uniref:Transcription factor domain-containing protein n=1 Tax=Peltaster fructicola TaxID=286661 RepID=A0A6H0XT87_9PEZI|nr:hypothetical protein AMS68_003372 [Peltaster fructicola]